MENSLEGVARPGETWEVREHSGEAVKRRGEGQEPIEAVALASDLARSSLAARGRGLPTKQEHSCGLPQEPMHAASGAPYGAWGHERENSKGPQANTAHGAAVIYAGVVA